MKNFQILLILALAGSCISQDPTLLGGSSSCKPEEEWRQCSTCEPTCDNPTPSCLKMCQPPKCMCKTSTFRTLEGSCVPATSCPPGTLLENSSGASGGSTKCPENEGIKTCAGCEPTCDVPNPICNKMCRKSRTCECLPGKYRNKESNKCVDVSECPLNTTARNQGGNDNKTCGENEELRSCPGCEPQCGELMRACPMICRLGQECECKTGYARNSDGKCVKVEDCPSDPAPRVTRSNSTDLKCEENEAVTECSGCEAECNFLNKMCPMICNGIPKCECASGFARDQISKKCIPRQQCPLNGGDGNNSTCGNNEELRSCPGCEPTCNNSNPICPMICRLGQECQCKQGFVRNDANECVLQSACPGTPPTTPGSGNPVCPLNEQWTTCGGCEGSCEDTSPICTAVCRPAGCYCKKPDYVRGPEGNCIHKDLCNNTTNNQKRDDGLTNPCAATLCPSGTVCQLKQVQCIRAPCPPQPTCVPIDKPVADPPVIRNPFCEVARCANGPCLPVAINCTTLNDCEYIGKCINRTVNGADIDVCENSTCPEDSKCDAEVIQCFAPPCLNIPKCVPTKQSDAPIPPVVGDPCEALNCPEGQICQKNRVACFTDPCPPVAQCVDAKNATEGERETRGTNPDAAIAPSCETMNCPKGTRCTFLAINCLRTPCPGSIPRCVPLPESDESQGDQTVLRVSRSYSTDLCEENEIITECTRCEAECNFLKKMCPMVCDGIPKCECAAGFARDATSKKCVLKEKCPPASSNISSVDEDHVCPENEEWTICGDCEGSCNDPDPLCLDACLPAKCTCKSKEYVRGPEGNCIHKDLCNNTTDNQKRDDGLTNPCAATLCPSGTVCQLKQVQCTRAPCPPTAQCVNATDTVEN
ncbi:hypothetical protein FO519_006004, partial [Halicephalobus sp. NKZ332]